MEEKNNTSVEENKIEKANEASESKQPPKKMRAQPKLKANSKETGFCVYIGPHIETVLSRGKVFDIPKEEVLQLPSIKSLVEKYPELRILIVSDETLASDRMKLKQPGNLLSSNYQKLITRLRGGRIDV